MKNLLVLLVFSALTFISCQSESKPTSSAKTSKADVSVPVATPAAAPAPVAAAPEADMMDEKKMKDEAPTVPAAATTATKSVKNMEKPAVEKMNKAKEMKDKMTEAKEDMTDKIAAEKEKMAAETAKMKAEAEMKAAEKAKEMKDKMKDEMGDKMADKTEMPMKHVQEKVEKVKEMKEEMAFSHKAFDGLLRKHVSSTGKVNYSGFKSDQAILEGYLKQLEAQPVESGWGKNKKLAYWINAYNAYTVDLIINNYPIKSITDLEGGKPWDKKFIKLNGKTLSLNDIENVIIRPTFKDARIHFAVNCAAKSCPPLMNKAWTASNLQSELEKRTKAFVNDSKHNTIGGGSATISKIFEWYAVDFGNLNDYLAKYNSSVNSSTSISYNEYDWSLNE